MKNRSLRALAILMAGGVVTFVGCGDGGPRLVSVTGVVTLNNKPLANALIQFNPDISNKDGLPAEDKTGPEGNYKAMSSGRSGMVPGKYKVVITKLPDLPAGGSGQFADDPFMAQLSAAPPTGPGTKKQAENMTIEESFDREVPAGGGTLDFDVKAKASAAAAATATPPPAKTDAPK